jgi:hypothetical protein
VEEKFINKQNVHFISISLQNNLRMLLKKTYNNVYGYITMNCSSHLKMSLYLFLGWYVNP